MSTRSNIAYEYPSGAVVRAYCHWDGYLEHNGDLLLKHYNSDDKALTLVKLGEIRSLEIFLDRVETYENAAPPRQYEDWQDACRNMEEYFYLWRTSEKKWYVLSLKDYKPGELIPLEEALKNT